MQTFLRHLSQNPEVSIHRDSVTGIAWAQWETLAPVQDPTTLEVTGHAPHVVRHYAHPSAMPVAATAFQRDGAHGWAQEHRVVVVQPEGRAINLSKATRITEAMDKAVHAECRCGGAHHSSQA